ncbi:conserved membrane protein of unknown function [Burkholderia multivorans]
MENPIAPAAHAALASRRPSFPLIAALIGFGIVLFTPAVLNDADTYWHLAAGAWMLQHGTVPLIDPFSFTFAGKPWIAHEWLSEVMMALAYRTGGWNGLVILFGAAAAATAGCLAHYLSRWLRQPAAAFTLTFGAMCVSPSLLARPHLIALPALAIWTVGLLSAKERGGAPPLRVLPIMLIWANLHGSFMLGLALIPAIAADALFDALFDAHRDGGQRDVQRILRDWSLFFAAAVAVALVTPNGWRGLLFPIQLTGMQNIASIGEWRPMDLLTLQPIEPALAALAFVVVSRRVRVPLPRLLILAGLAYLAYRHGRHQMLAGIVGAAVLAEPLGRAFGAAAPTPARTSGRELRATLASGFACAALLSAIRFAHPIVRGDDAVSPASALAAVPAALREQPVLNSYSFGGYLIFNHVRPFIDGRADMYGDAFMFAYLDALKPDRAAFERLVEQYRIRWALLDAHSAAAAMAATLPGWRRIYADDIAAVFVRDTH